MDRRSDGQTSLDRFMIDMIKGGPVCCINLHKLNVAQMLQGMKIESHKYIIIINCVRQINSEIKALKH